MVRLFALFSLFLSANAMRWDNPKADIYYEINQGWLVVKLVECIIIPYCYYLLHPNKIAFLLFLVAIINIFHNTLAVLAIYMSNLHPELLGEGGVVQVLWYCQAISAAVIRCIELYVNYIITGKLGSKIEKHILLVLSILGGGGVFIGRIYDVYEIHAAPSSIRWGLTFVSFSCMFSSSFGIYMLSRTLLITDVHFI
jgi:hypothetical protein